MSAGAWAETGAACGTSTTVTSSASSTAAAKAKRERRAKLGTAAWVMPETIAPNA